MPNAAKQQKISVGESRRSTTRPVAVPDSGMLDEYALQEKSRRIQEGVDDGGVLEAAASRTEVDEEVESVFEANPNYQDPKGVQGTALRAAVAPCSAAGR